jgi:hypothetical protein
MARGIRVELNQELKLAGVVGTLTSPDGSLYGREQQLIETIVEDALQEWNGAEGPYMFKRTIPRRAAMSSALMGALGYFTDDDAKVSIRDILDEFGGELAKRIKLP